MYAPPRSPTEPLPSAPPAWQSTPTRPRPLSTDTAQSLPPFSLVPASASAPPPFHPDLRLNYPPYPYTDRHRLPRFPDPFYPPPYSASFPWPPIPPPYHDPRAQLAQQPLHQLCERHAPPLDPRERRDPLHNMHAPRPPPHNLHKRHVPLQDMRQNHAPPRHLNAHPTSLPPARETFNAHYAPPPPPRLNGRYPTLDSPNAHPHTPTTHLPYVSNEASSAASHVHNPLSHYDEYNKTDLVKLPPPYTASNLPDSHPPYSASVDNNARLKYAPIEANHTRSKYAASEAGDACMHDDTRSVVSDVPRSRPYARGRGRGRSRSRGRDRGTSLTYIPGRRGAARTQRDFEPGRVFGEESQGWEDAPSQEDVILGDDGQFGSFTPHHPPHFPTSPSACRESQANNAQVPAQSASCSDHTHMNGDHNAIPQILQHVLPPTRHNASPSTTLLTEIAGEHPSSPGSRCPTTQSEHSAPAELLPSQPEFSLPAGSTPQPQEPSVPSVRPTQMERPEDLASIVSKIVSKMNISSDEKPKSEEHPGPVDSPSPAPDGVDTNPQSPEHLNIDARNFVPGKRWHVSDTTDSTAISDDIADVAQPVESHDVHVNGTMDTSSEKEYPAIAIPEAKHETHVNRTTVSTALIEKPEDSLTNADGSDNTQLRHILQPSLQYVNGAPDGDSEEGVSLSPYADVLGDEQEESDQRLSSDILDAVVKIYATHCDPNYSLPWQMRRQTQSTSSGFVISGRTILTNAHSVEHYTVVRVKKRAGDQKYIAKVLATGNECDLALLTVLDEEFWEGLKPISFGSLPQLQASVIVVGYPIGGENISVTAGVVSRIEIQDYTHGASQLLGIQIDAAINSGSSGGPALNPHNEVVGIAFQSLSTGDSENIGYLVAGCVVDHFLRDFEKNGRYTGFCHCGFQWQRMENISLRRCMKMNDEDSGILVRRVNKTSPALNVLEQGDIITAIDGESISNAGTVPYRSGERISFHYIITTKFTGDPVQLRILRNGKYFNVEYELRESSENLLVPVHERRRQPEYFTIAGLVFVALSEPYLAAEYGNKWDLKAPVRLLERLMYGSKETKDEQVVVLAQVLNAEINIGYEYLINTRVHKFNGVRLQNLGHLARLVDACEDDFLRFDLDDEVVVVGREEAITASQEILETHCIPSACSIGELASPIEHGGNLKRLSKK